MILCAKIMPKFRRCISTGHGLSEDYYGGEHKSLAGTGQGNKFSGDMCRDVSCLIAKVLENKKYGINIKSKASKEEQLCTSVAFVDDIDLAEDGPQAQDNMQVMIVDYENLHSSSGGCV